MCYDSRIRKEEIRKWLHRGIESGATHCLVVSDCWDDDDFPVYIMPGQDAKKVARSYFVYAPDSERLMEVYNLKMDVEPQLEEHRAMNF